MGVVAVAFAVLVFLAALTLGVSGGTPVVVTTSARPLDAPVLTLVPDPPEGNAPLEANVTATVSGGVAPYNLSVCFGSIDHTSPPFPCGVGASDWSGLTPLVFSHNYTAAGNYSVTGILTDARGAEVGSTALIVVTEGVALAATASELTGPGSAPLVARFNESVVGGTPPITLQWAFGDGSSGSELPGVPVLHTYTAPGTYVPTLTVTDGAGHHTVRTLAAITVTARPGGGPIPGVSGWSIAVLAELAAAFAATALAVAVAVTLVARRRWRREGDELVRRLRSAETELEERPGRP
jgi:PKD repeat protein